MSTSRPSSKVVTKRLSPLLRLIQAETRSARFNRFITDLLVELCQINTTAGPDIDRMRQAEGTCFKILERELAALRFRHGHECRRESVNPAIQNSPHFSLLHFTKTAACPGGLTPEEVYRNRSNLLYLVHGSGKNKGKAIAVNAHLDVVAPYFSPRVARGIVHGRGACDDKGPVVAIVAALKVLSSVLAKTQLAVNRNVLAMFVIEEETGGNGSLSLALDRKIRKLYDSVLVCECTDLKLHPANRGAVWYRASLKAPPGKSVLELASAVVLALENEGAAIRAESRHPLFPQRPVQTCHGIVGGFGEHPSRICGRVAFKIKFARQPSPRVAELISDCLESGLSQYVGSYGDKTKVTDPGTGKPMVKKHYEVLRKAHGFEVTVFGAPGHMGSIRERDGAITKMAHLVRSLVASRRRIESFGRTPFELVLSNAPSGPHLVLEGGQGFVPTHTIDEVMERMRAAARRGAELFLRQSGVEGSSEELFEITYEKLHNVAFDGDPDSPTMGNALAAAKTCGVWTGEPVLGWTVSCDARLFASEYPEMDVLTFGPGKLAFAHSDHEQIAVEEIRRAVEFLCLFLLLQTGTVR